MSGGSQAVARAIFAVGHMLPAFALLMIAAGLGLLLEEDPPQLAYWLACIGLGIYLGGTRALRITHGRFASVARTAVLVATFFLAWLEPALSPYGYVWLLTGWVLICAVLTTRALPRDPGEELARLTASSGRARPGSP